MIWLWWSNSPETCVAFALPWPAQRIYDYKLPKSSAEQPNHLPVESSKFWPLLFRHNSVGCCKWDMLGRELDRFMVTILKKRKKCQKKNKIPKKIVTQSHWKSNTIEAIDWKKDEHEYEKETKSVDPISHKIHCGWMEQCSCVADMVSSTHISITIVNDGNRNVWDYHRLYWWNTVWNLKEERGGLIIPHESWPCNHGWHDNA